MSRTRAADVVVSSSSNIESEYDVVIMGAGWAGLTAARDISQQTNLSVLLVEARDRIGGRTWTAKELGQEFEMGGNWVLWTQPHVWTELHRYGFDKHICASLGKKITDQKALYEGIEAVAQAFFNIDGYDSRTLMPFPHEPFRLTPQPQLWRKYDSMSIADRMQQIRTISQKQLSEECLQMFETISAGTGLTSTDKRGFVEFLFWYVLGGHSIANMGEATGIYRIGNGGMTAFAKAVFADFRGDVLMNTPITEVNQEEDMKASVELVTKDGRRITAGKVISTISLNVLSSIKVTPPFSSLRNEAVAAGQVNRGIKLHFEDTNPDQGIWGTFCSPQSDCLLTSGLADHRDNNRRATYGLAFGYSVSNLDLCDATAVKHELQKSSPSIRAWCGFAPGFTSKYQRALQEPHRNVMFTSADWADGWRGFVDGTLGAGIEAARIIIEGSG